MYPAPKNNLTFVCHILNHIFEGLDFAPLLSLRCVQHTDSIYGGFVLWDLGFRIRGSFRKGFEFGV